MKHYGYLDMPDDYTDIAYWHVTARCIHCGQTVNAIREDCWEQDGQLVTDCMCSELPTQYESTPLDTAADQAAAAFCDTCKFYHEHGGCQLQYCAYRDERSELSDPDDPYNDFTNNSIPLWERQGYERP